MTPASIGRIVIYHLGANDGFRNNGAKEAPAVIVRAWNDTYVNLKVLTDGANDAWVTSKRHESLHDDSSKITEGYWTWPREEDNQ